MCLHPITLNAPPEYCTYQASVDRLFSPGYYRRKYPLVLTVPCGKCVECIKKRQSDYLQVYYLLAQRYGSMHFVTLTYDNEHIPVAVREELPYVDQDGFVIYGPPVLDHPLCDQLRSLYFTRYIKGLYTPQVLFLDGQSYTVTPSVSRREARLWLKAARVKYKFDYGENLPKFSYSLVPEYGLKTSRPHYHILFFGLDDKLVNYLVNRWQNGFTFVENIPVNSGDQSRAAVSNYVSKYITKGIFEQPYLRKGLDGEYNCERARVCSSRDLVQLPEKMEAYYNLDDLSSTFFYSPDFDISDRLISRQHIHIGKYDYKLGRHLIDYLYKYKVYEIEFETVFFVPEFTPIYDEQGRVLALDRSGRPSGSRVKRLPDGTVFKEVYRVRSKTKSTSLYKDCKERLQMLHDVRVHNQLEEIQRFYPDSSNFEVAEQFFEAEKLALETRAACASKSLKSFYQRSNF